MSQRQTIVKVNKHRKLVKLSRHCKTRDKFLRSRRIKTAAPHLANTEIIRAMSKVLMVVIEFKGWKEITPVQTYIELSAR